MKLTVQGSNLSRAASCPIAACVVNDAALERRRKGLRMEVGLGFWGVGVVVVAVVGVGDNPKH